MSTDYHDYVFRDGKLVGDFEEMYKNSTVIPWHQDKQENWIDIRLTREILADVGKFTEVHDFGCGTGHYLSLMAKYVGMPNGRFFGYDISKTACAQAKQNFPLFSFEPLDLTLNSAVTMQIKSNRLFMIRGTLWYVIPKLEVAISNIRASMHLTDKLLVVQNFPPLHSAFIGKDVLPDHISLIEWFSSYFVLERHVWYENSSNLANDNWFIGFFSTKDI